MSLQELEQAVIQLSAHEKIQLLQWVVHNLQDHVPGIEKRPGVAGGAACIVGTRIPVWAIIQAQRLGMTDSEIVAMYPLLDSQALANAWAYSQVYPQEIEAAIDLQENS